MAKEGGAEKPSAVPMTMLRLVGGIVVLLDLLAWEVITWKVLKKKKVPHKWAMAPINVLLSGTAIVYVSGRNNVTFDDALREAVLKYVPMGRIFKTNGKVADNFVSALNFAYREFPNASWYYIADDDSFVHLERLARLMQSHYAGELALLGHHDCAGTSCGRDIKVNCKRQEMLANTSNPSATNPGWACGGPGLIVSQPLAAKMVAAKCQDYYGNPNHVAHGDMALACCAWDVWKGMNITDVRRLSPYDAENQLQKPEEAVSIHHISPSTIRRLGQIFNAHLPVIQQPPGVKTGGDKIPPPAQ